MMFQANQQIGIYTLVKILGRGGFGEVWLAENRTALLSKKVAVKLPLYSMIDLETVRREAVLWEQASGHPNVLPIIEANIYNGQVVIVSEYAPDGSLADLLKKEGELPLENIVKLAVGISAGLEFLHSRRIIHRDLKPANILLQGETPRLADFGISHALQTSVSSRSTNIKGTFAYMSPEAFDGVRNEQTDIWSFGVILYQMLKGVLPFPQIDATSLLKAIVMNDPEPLPAFVPANLQAIVGKCLAKSSANRYQSAKEVRLELEKELVRIQHPTDAPTDILIKKDIFQTNDDIKIGNETITDVISNTDLILIQTEKEKGDSEKLNPPLETDVVKEVPQTGKQFVAKTSNKNYKIGLLVAGLLGLIVLIYAGIAGLGFLTEYLKSKKSASSFEPSLIPYRKGDKWGYVDKNKKITIEPKYQRTYPFDKDGIARVQSLKTSVSDGFINTSGNSISTTQYGDVDDFQEDLALVSKKVAIFLSDAPENNVGFIDKKGNVAIPFNYQWGCSFSQGLACVAQNKKFGFIDKQGKTIIPFIYEAAGSFNKDGLAPVKGNGKWMLIDKTGKIVQTFNDEVFYTDFDDGWLTVKKSGGYNAIDKNGRYVSSSDFEFMRWFSNGLAEVNAKDKWGFIDTTGKQIIPIKYENVNSYKEGLIPVKKDGKWGFVDKDDKTIIPFKYYSADSFDSGLAFVQISEGKGFYITHDGTEYLDDSEISANTNANNSNVNSNPNQNVSFNIHSNINLNNTGQNSNTNTTPNNPSIMTNKIGMEFVQVPAGSFMMGDANSNAPSDSDMLPVHEVTFSKPFYIGRYEVTQKQWKELMQSNPSYYKGGENLPVNTLNWNMAQSFVKKLNELNDGYTYRLPSEAEWEYACRAGTKGDFAGNEGEMRKSSDWDIQPVGQTKPNPWGIYDMHGNGVEWVADVWHYNYKGAPTDGSAWNTGGVQAWRILRGGASQARQEAKIIDVFGNICLRVAAVPK